MFTRLMERRRAHISHLPPLRLTATVLSPPFRLLSPLSVRLLSTFIPLLFL